MVRAIDPKKKKRKPKGTKITLRGRNKAEKTTSKKNKPISDKKKSRVAAINKSRAEKALKKGRFKNVTSTKTVSPARIEIVRPASTRKVTERKYVPEEVRAGSSKSFGKELPKGKKPSTKGTGRGSRLQKALEEGRKQKKEIVKFEGKDFRAGRYETSTREEKVPAITKNIPAVTKEVTKKIPEYNKKVIKGKKKPRRISFVQSVNARPKRVSATQGKK